MEGFYSSPYRGCATPTMETDMNYPKHNDHNLPQMIKCGLSQDDAVRLRRDAMILHRWHELECGVEGGGVERDEITGKVSWYSDRTGRRSPYPDKETPALKRVAQVMARYPTLGYHVQGDPRGCALYILRPGDVPAGENPDSYYSRGVAVY